MKRLSLKEVQQRYNTKLELAKEKFKSEKNLTVARGFKDSPEFKKISTSKKNAVKRKIKQINTGVSTALFNNYNQTNQKPTTSNRAKLAKQSGITSPVFWIADHEIFYLVLSYGGKVKLVQSEKEKLENQGKEVTVTVFYPNGSSVTTTNEAVFLHNIETLYTQLVELEDKTSKYPLVDILSFGITPQKSAITVRPVNESDWLTKAKK